MKEVEVIQVVRTTLLRRGTGRSLNSPIRCVTQYWSLTGELLAEYDPCATVTTHDEPSSEST